MAQSIKEKLNRHLILFLARRLPPCRVMTELFSDSRERPASLRERIVMRLHLYTCRACRRYVAQIEQMSGFYKPSPNEMPNEKSPEKLSTEARRRIRAALETSAHHKN